MSDKADETPSIKASSAGDATETLAKPKPAAAPKKPAPAKASPAASAGASKPTPAKTEAAKTEAAKTEAAKTSGTKAAAPAAKKPAARKAKTAAPKPAAKSAEKPASAPQKAAAAKATKPADPPRPPKSEAKPAKKPEPVKKPTGTPQAAEDIAMPDPAEWSKNMMLIATQSQKLVGDFITRQGEQGKGGPLDPLNVTGAFTTLLHRMLSDPTRIIDAQMSLWKSHMDLWQMATKRFLGETVDPIIEPQRGDKRFRHPEWQENQIFDYVKQSYLLTARWMQQTVADVEGLDDKDKAKVDFYTRQFADAIAPSNFLITNPEVLQKTIDSSGENLVKGLENLIEDMERGKGKLNIRQADLEYFEVGKNVATTPGKVVFQNHLFQLVQYTPTTEKVNKTPLLIFPPWINKFYILDLQPENSLIKWLVDQGHTVFVTSWVNPGPELAEKTFENYMFEGIYAALDAVTEATGEKEVNTVGYCIGGTLLGATLGYMAKKNVKTIKSATFFTAQHDFSEAGELSIFIDDEQLAALEQQMDQAGGVLDGHAMATTFNMLRANDLIWSYVVNNYLLGKEPFRFDLLYWNSDSTRMPKALHLEYLRRCYNDNALAQGEMVLDGEAIDLSLVKTPIYFQSAKEDHIAPHPSVYKGTKLFGGPVKFMVGGSGHIAGVINPPSANKYMYWINDGKTKDLDDWWKGAKEYPGSWWPDWNEWLLEQQTGDRVKARVPGDGKLKVIEDAPGSYVKVRADA